MSRTPSAHYWLRARRLALSLLGVWFAVTFVAGWHARALSFDFLGWPFSFYLAAQGAPLVYLAIVAFHAYRSRRIDRQFGIDEPQS